MQHNPSSLCFHQKYKGLEKQVNPVSEPRWSSEEREKKKCLRTFPFPGHPSPHSITLSWISPHCHQSPNAHYYRTVAVLMAGHIMIDTGLSWHIVTHSLLLMLIFWDRRIHCLAIACDASNPKERKVSAFRQTHPMVIDGVPTSYKMQQKLGKSRAQCDLQES